MKDIKSCAVLGCSPMRFAWGFDEEDSKCKEMKLELLQQIMVLRQLGVTSFAVACDPGVGLYAAEAVNALRETDGDLLLFCVTPHEEQATKWPPYLRERYFTMLEKCTYITAVSLHPTPTSQLDAYERIIDQSDMVLAVYDAASKRSDEVDTAMDYAGALHRQIVLVHPETFTISVQTNI